MDKNKIFLWKWCFRGTRHKIVISLTECNPLNDKGNFSSLCCHFYAVNAIFTISKYFYFKYIDIQGRIKEWSCLFGKITFTILWLSNKIWNYIKYLFLDELRITSIIYSKTILFLNVQRSKCSIIPKQFPYLTSKIARMHIIWNSSKACI